MGNAPGRTGEVAGSQPRDGVKLGQGSKYVKVSMVTKTGQDRELRTEVDKGLVHGREGLLPHRMGYLLDGLGGDGSARGIAGVGKKNGIDVQLRAPPRQSLRIKVKTRLRHKGIDVKGGPRLVEAA